MKITKCLVLSLFLLAFTDSFPSPASFMATAIHSANDHLPVFDINGQKLRTDEPYYVEANVLMEQNESASHDIPTLHFSAYQACPDVILLSTETKFPVRILPVTSKDAIIREDTYLTIRSDIDFLCRVFTRLVWGIREREGKPVLTVKGVRGVDQFVITKYKDEKYTYLLSFCKPRDGTECRRLGHFTEDGVIYVSIDGPSIPVRFRPAPETLDIIKEVVTN